MSGAPVEALAIVLARAGSKGVPGKNRALLAGRPCVAYTIEHCRASAHVGMTAVSTDDAIVARIAREMGCMVVDRPADLAADRARVDDAARHALSTLAADDPRWSRATLPVVILYANVPIRPVGLVDRAVEMLMSTGCDSVQSYAPVGKHHPWWTARVEAGSGEVRPWEGEVLNHGVFRRQDLPLAYIPDGGVIACTRRALMLEVAGVAAGPHAFFGRDRRGVINPEGSVVDIDSPIDLVVAEALLSGRG